MIRAATLTICLAVPAVADPLDLIDYPGIFAQNADAVEEVSETRKILRLGDITLIHDPTEMRPYTGIDESGRGAAGCLVSVLASIDSALLACEVALPAEQLPFQQDFTERALQFYAENSSPAADMTTVTARYADYVQSQVEGALPLCSNIDLITNLADRLFTPAGEAQVTNILSLPRLPVENPCL
ncbi:MAG: hypothetical protein AAFU41_02020 [Pseudomonadota bacterium]